MSSRARGEPDKARKRKWDVSEVEGSPTSGRRATDDSDAGAEGLSSKRLCDALRKAREHAAQINSTIPSLQQGRAPGSLADQQGGAPGSLVDQQSRASGSLAGQGSLSKSGQPAVESVDETRRKVMLGREELSKDVEINDVKNRYIITRGATQIKIKQDTGADVVTRGKFYPDKSMATHKDPESLDKAIEIINNIINQPPMTLDGGKRSCPSLGDRDKFAFSEDMPVDIDPDRSFNIRAKILGPGGAYVKHVQQETATKVQLKGKGSGYLEPSTNKEAQVPLYISIGGATQEAVDSAKALCEDLLNNVKNEYNRLKQQRMARIQQPVMQPGYMDMHIPMPPLALGQPGAYQGYAQPYVPMAHMIPGTPAQQLYQMGSEITDSVAMQAQYSQYYQYGYGPLAPQVHPAPQAQPPSPQPQPSPKSQPSPPPSPPPPSDPPEN